MPDQTVSGVTAGDSGGLGRPTTFLSSYNGGSLSLDFTAPYTLPSTLSVAFYFGGQQVITAGAGSQGAHGTGAVTNAALSFAPTGFDSLQFSRTTVYTSAENNGAAVDFLFTESYTPPYPPYAPFSFGGQIVIAKIGAGVQTTFGKPSLDSRLRIALRDDVDGISPQLAFGRARVSPELGLDFLFVDAYTPTTALNTPFYFGGQVIVSTRGADSSRFGTPSFDAPATVAPVGFNSNIFSRTGLRFEGANGVGVDFLFTDPYTPPPATDVPFIFPFVSLEGIARISVSAQVQAQAAQLSGSAVATTTASAFLKPSAELAGTASISASGSAELTNVEPVVVSGINANVFGVPLVADAIRTISVPAEAPSTEWGVPIVGPAVRVIAPVGFLNYQPPVQLQYGTATVTFSERTIFPEGYDALAFELPDVARNELIIGSIPFVDSQFGATSVGLYTRSIRILDGIYEFVGNPVQIYNLTQYLQHFTPWEDYTETTVISGRLIHLQYGEPNVVNRNKTVSPEGLYRTRIGTDVTIRNNAQIVWPQVGDVSLYGDCTVTHGIRTIEVLRFDRSIERYLDAIVYNRSFEIKPLGTDYLGIGAPAVIDTTQWIRGRDTYDPVFPFGTPFVAFRIRYLGLDADQNSTLGDGIGPGDVGEHSLFLNPQYITPIAPTSDLSIDQMRSPIGGVGYPYVREEFSIIRCLDIYGQAFGQASVVNNTPQLFTGTTAPLLEVGTPTIWYRVRTLDLHREGIPRTQTFAIQPPWVIHVGFKLKRISLNLPSNGIAPPRITDLHIVYTDIPRVNPPQKIDLIGQGVEPYGCISSGAVCYWGSNTEVRNVHQTIAVEGWKGEFGSANVSNNGIFTLWDYPSSHYGFGTPTITGRPAFSQAIYLWLTNSTTGARDPLSIVEWGFGQHRLSPQYIFCDRPPIQPLGAMQYDPDTNSYFTDTPTASRPLPFFGGDTRVTLQYRRVTQVDPYASGTDDHDEIRHKIELKDRQLFVDGIEPGYVNYPEVFPQTLYIYPVDWVSHAFGLTDVYTDPYVEPLIRTISVAGQQSFAFGEETQIENFHRYLTPPGWLSFENRSVLPLVPNLDSLAGPFPYAPRGFTDVYSPPRGPRPPGWDSALYGTAMVAYRIRTLAPEGFESFTMGYSIGTFDQRMRIRHLNFKIEVEGAEMTGYGEPVVRNAQLRLYPFQIAPPRCGVSHDASVH